MKTTKQLFIMLIMLSVLMFAYAPLSLAGIQGADQGIKEIVSQVHSSFPVLELYVISVDKDKVILEKDAAGKIRPGVELHLFREGEEFTHPLTGKKLGRFEEPLGNLRVISVKENYAEGKIISAEPGAAIKRGDKARITATKIKLAIFQVINLSAKDIDEESLTYQLIDQLEETNRFEIVQMGELITVLDKLNVTDYQQLADDSIVKKLGQMLGIRGIVATQLREIDNKLILEAKLLSAYTGTPISKTSVVLTGVTPGYASSKPVLPALPVPKGGKLDLSRGGMYSEARGWT